MLAIGKRFAHELLHPPLHRPDTKFSHMFLGTKYGGWPLITEGINPETLIYSFGVGEDISFDLAAIDQFGCRVKAFDPTPISLAWIEQQDLPEQFRFAQ